LSVELKITFFSWG